jgi:hypothetical protein
MQVFTKEWWSNLFAAQAEAEGAPIAAQLEHGASRTVQISAAQLAQIEAASAPLAAASAPDPRTAELEAEIARLRKMQIERDASAFADKLITIEHKALPAERNSLIAAYTQAAQDDAAHPLSGASRTSLLEALTAERPAHQLTKELIGDPALLALSGGKSEDGGDFAQERAQAKAYAQRANGKH